MHSFAAFAILIFATVFAGILIASPVTGFRPIRALRLEKTSFPIPGIVKDPDFLISEIARAGISSRMDGAVFLVRSNFPAKWDTICPLVIGALAISSSSEAGLYLSARVYGNRGRGFKGENRSKP